MKVKIITICLILVNFFSCDKKKEINNENHNSIINMKEVRSNFKQPDKSLFESKINEFFGIDINKYDESQQIYTGNIVRKKENEKVLIPRYGFISESEKQPIVNLSDHFILWEDEEEDEASLLYLNKYIFYNDNVAFNNLKSSKSGYLYYLFIDFGYCKDQKLTDFILEEVGIDFDTDESNEFATRVFVGSNGLFGKKQLRKDVVRQYFNKYPNSDYLYFNLAKIILEYNTKGNGKYEGDQDRDAAFLLEVQLEYAKKQLGTLVHGGIDSVLKQFPDFFNKLKRNNSFNYTLLSEYKLYNDEGEEFIGYSKVFDSEGWINIRESNSINANVVDTINSGSEVFLLSIQDEWIKIETEDGKKGYVHKSRIKSE